MATVLRTALFSLQPGQGVSRVVPLGAGFLPGGSSVSTPGCRGRSVPKKKVPHLAEIVPLRPEPKKPPRRLVKPQPPVENEAAERTLVEMARHISSSEGPTEALRAQLQLIHLLMQAKACYVAPFLPSRNQLHVEHGRGRYDERITAATPEEGLIGRAFAQ